MTTLMLVFYGHPLHNGIMTKELTPTQDAVIRGEPDYRKVARLIAEVPGHEDFPCDDVERIMNHPGELIVTTLQERGSSFIICATIAAEHDPFMPVVNEQNDFRELKINPKSIETPRGAIVHASQEIVMSTDIEPPHHMSTWTNGYIHHSDTVTLASGNPIELSIGTDDVSARIRALAEHKDMQRTHMKSRLAGALFHVALLADEFGAPVPTLPETLHAEHAAARAYYVAAKQRAMAIIDTKSAIERLSNEATNSALIKRPDIHFERPLEDIPPERIADASRSLIHPTRDRVIAALASYKHALRIIDSLDPPYDA